MIGQFSATAYYRSQKKRRETWSEENELSVIDIRNRFRPTISERCALLV